MKKKFTFVPIYNLLVTNNDKCYAILVLRDLCLYASTMLWLEYQLAVRAMLLTDW